MADHSDANDGAHAPASPQSTAITTEDDAVAAPPPAAKKTTSVKAAAEARRRRILEASNKRMGIVSGDFEGDDEVSADAKDGAGDATEAEEGEGTSTPVATKAGGGGGASRLQAMRRKRAKQRQAAAAAASSAGPEPAGEGAASTDQSQTAPGAPTSTKVEETESAKADAPAAAPSSAEPTEKETTADDDVKPVAEAATKKKYMGVAKMRRKMLSDKKKKEEEEGVPSSGTHPKTIPPSLSTVAESATRVPILMQLLTTVLLFLAGLDIGLDHSLFGERAVELRDKDVLKFGVGPIVEGVGALKLLEPLGVGGRASSLSSTEEKERLLVERQRQERDVASAEHEADEFREQAPDLKKPAGASSTFREPNIDPIFRVDLDELTSGPGLLMMLARMAVSCHRALLYLFLTLPMSILTSIIFLPKSLLASPPVLFLVSTVIRTFGRSVLGAHLPDTEALQQSSADPSGDTEKGSKGLLEMARGAAKNAIAKNFPAAYAIFTILKDARTDMYVVLCGLLVGLALPLHLGLGDAKVGEAGKGEL